MASIGETLWPHPPKAHPSLSGTLGGTMPMGLTPQEDYLWQHHMRNLQSIGTGGVRNKDGSVSTVYQSVITGPDGRFYSIPTIWGGKVLGIEESAAKARARGLQNWPSYSTPQAADARYQQMHQFMDPRQARVSMGQRY